MAVKNYSTGKSAASSIAEIQSALAQHGAIKIMTDWENGKPIAISFGIPSNVYGQVSIQCYRLPAPVAGTRRVFEKQKIRATEDQAEMTAWRNVRDWIMAQLALVESCGVEVEEVFLPYLTNSKGQTLYETYSSGRLMLDDPSGV